MTAIVIHEFGGMQPRIGDQYLATEAASDAENCLLLSGELRPLHAPSLLNVFYPGNSHQRNTDLFQPQLDPLPEGPYDQYIEDNYPGILLWMKGINGLSNDQPGGDPIAAPDISRTGVPELVFEPLGDPLLTDGASFDPAGGFGFQMEHVWLRADEYLPANPVRGTLSIGREESGNINVGYVGDTLSAFGEKFADDKTASRPYLPYSAFCSVNTVVPSINQPNASVGLFNGTYEVAGVSVSQGGESDSTIVTPAVDVPPAQSFGNWSVGFFQSPSDGIGGATSSTFNANILGHAGALYRWNDSPFVNDILLQFPNVNYTFHMIVEWIGDLLGNPNTQVMFRSGEGVSSGSGVYIAFDGTAIRVQHGRSQVPVIVFDLSSQNFGKKHIVVTHDRVAGTVQCFVNGVPGPVVNINIPTPGVGGTFDDIGRGILNRPGPNNSTWPLLGRWQHLWYGGFVVTPQEAADLYAAAVDAGF